ncbi:hypothetical protein GCK72_004735 [Caenorhabditis remanei]|uniref:Ricin B lectin domain-containing protein n=1 Tax=Caenorhabditis remanei TaxID=31234 RepID=A0A6A5HBZ8_CAERE|nr:hypothetical protein GCK72_004735 [Caenorhabditis remanei]KAF1764785.1 hypothetical protein GCK72_004735 [Caenorhabditis remanei]
MWSTITIVTIFVVAVDSGSVGLCRTECIEQNARKIVRVHLKDDLVMAGLCNNKTDTTEGSIVTPYVCHKNVGLWTLDELDEEGVVSFDKLCPTPEQYPYELRSTCPRINENRDETPMALDVDEYPASSGDTPLLLA